MRLTEYIDLINRKDLPTIEEYSHLEIREEIEDAKEDAFGNKPLRLIKKYRTARKLNKKGSIMVKQKNTITILCVETHKGFRWFHKEEEARAFAINAYSNEPNPLDDEEYVIGKPPIYEHTIKLSPKGICKLLNAKELDG